MPEAPSGAVTARHKDFIRSITDGKRNDRLQAIYDRALHENRNKTEPIAEHDASDSGNRSPKKCDGKKREKRREKDKEGSMPFAAARAMLQQRLQAIVMQDKHHMRSLWSEFDTDGKNYLTPKEFHAALGKLGIEIEESESDKMMTKFSRIKDKLYYEDFVLNFLTLPKDFFTQNHVMTQEVMNRLKEKSDEGPAQAQLQKMLPPGTSVDTIDKIFRTRIRKQLLNVNRCMSLVLKRQNCNTKFLGKGELYNIFDGLGIMCTQRELDELLKYFDHNDDGKIHYEEMAHELLKLPRPNELRGSVKKVDGGDRASRQRAQLAPRTKELLHCLRLNCERASVTPTMLVELFKHFDTDGSGQVAYDEIKEMVREYGCNIEGADAAGMLLERYVGDSGVMSYIQFITKVLGLRPDSLRGDDNKDRMSTPELQQAAASSFKSKLYKNPKALKKAFERFDRDGSGQLSYKEFCDGVMALGLPIDPVNCKKIFNSIDADGSGHITTQELAHHILKVPESSSSPRKGDAVGTQRGEIDSSEAATSRLGSTLSSRFFDPFQEDEESSQCYSVTSSPQKKLSSQMKLIESRGRPSFSGPPRSASVPLPSLPSTRSRGNYSLLDELIASHRSSPGQSPAGTTLGAGAWGAPPTTRRSAPKTASQMKAEARLSQQRNTFLNTGPTSKRSPPPGVPWLPDLSAKQDKLMPRMDQDDLPHPVQKVHAIDGRQTVGFKKVGMGGLTKSREKEWIGGADRTCNVHIGQPRGGK